MRERSGARRARKLLATITAGLTAVLIAGCTPQEDLALNAPNADGSTTSVDARVVEIATAERGAPVEFEGTDEYGDTVGSADYAGRVYVVNFWYAACAPCRVEAPILQDAWEAYQDDEVGFIGINTYDQPATAISFAEEFGITYPSVIDVIDSQATLAFSLVTPIQATPTTLVMDRQGRVAARIIGQIPSASILATLVEDAVAEAP